MRRGTQKQYGSFKTVFCIKESLMKLHIYLFLRLYRWTKISSSKYHILILSLGHLCQKKSSYQVARWTFLIFLLSYMQKRALSIRVQLNELLQNKKPVQLPPSIGDRTLLTLRNTLYASFQLIVYFCWMYTWE